MTATAASSVTTSAANTNNDLGSGLGSGFGSGSQSNRTKNIYYKLKRLAIGQLWLDGPVSQKIPLKAAFSLTLAPITNFTQIGSQGRTRHKSLLVSQKKQKGDIPTDGRTFL